jgi:hypothetical protein
MSNFHVCDWLATVRWRDCRRQAMLSYTQKLPRQLCMAVLSIFLFPAVIAGLSQPRRLLGPVFDDAEVTFMLARILVQPFLKPSACGSFRR